jgi:hypothetical protein
LELTEQQQLVAALLLIILLAGSLLYCLGFASLALRQVTETFLEGREEVPVPSGSPMWPADDVELLPMPNPTQPPQLTATPS